MEKASKTHKELLLEITQLRACIAELERSQCEMESSADDYLHHWQIQTVLNKLLHISLENIPLESMLEQFIEEITSLPWLALKSKGAIFLTAGNQDVLEMKAHRAISDALVQECSRVPFGLCLCGLAAKTGEIQFADKIDLRHVIQYAGMTPHGHYCIPIVSGTDNVLGVITLYLREGQDRNQSDEAFLIAVARTLAGIIERERILQQLEERGAELEQKSHDLKEMNTALRVLIKKKDEDREAIEQKILLNLNELVTPYLEKLAASRLNKQQCLYLDILSSHLEEIISPFTKRLYSPHFGLTATEIQVASLVKQGKRTKEIADLMNVSHKTVEVHRKHIRRKLGLNQSKANLRTHLLSL
ncbi:MAG: GAF domain-containing protein [Desulfosarcina sp.]|nr:GAF domain-containing protein [Desulfobacterales bacterium]